MRSKIDKHHYSFFFVNVQIFYDSAPNLMLDIFDNFNVLVEKLTVKAIASSSKSHIFSGSLLLSYNPRNPVAV